MGGLCWKDPRNIARPNKYDLPCKLRFAVVRLLYDVPSLPGYTGDCAKTVVRTSYCRFTYAFWVGKIHPESQEDNQKDN